MPKTLFAVSTSSMPILTLLGRQPEPDENLRNLVLAALEDNNIPNDFAIVRHPVSGAYTGIIRLYAHERGNAYDQDDDEDQEEEQYTWHQEESD